MRPRKTEIKLADGRALYYFDESPNALRATYDSRALTRTARDTEIRRDPLLDQWVIIASHRQTRTYQPSDEQCPLCPSRAGRATEIPASDYDVVVFENRFAALSQPPPRADPATEPPPTYADPATEPPPTYSDPATEPSPARGDPATGARLLERHPNTGRCEVVCFTSDHDTSLGSLPPRRVATVIAALADRTRELGTLPGVEYVLCFENRGAEIGGTLPHPHGQIYAYPFVPPHVRTQLERARRHRDRTGGCLHCDLLAAERAANRRVVYETPHWTVVVPYAARWPFEAHVYPRRHTPDLPSLTDTERADLAEVYRDLLQRFDGLFQAPIPYIAQWVQAPARNDRDLAHLYGHVFSIRRAPGKLKHLGGSESGSGVWVNDITPEDAAERLRTATRTATTAGPAQPDRATNRPPPAGNGPAGNGSPA